MLQFYNVEIFRTHVSGIVKIQAESRAQAVKVDGVAWSFEIPSEQKNPFRVL